MREMTYGERMGWRWPQWCFKEVQGMSGRLSVPVAEVESQGGGYVGLAIYSTPL